MIITVSKHNCRICMQIKDGMKPISDCYLNRLNYHIIYKLCMGYEMKQYMHLNPVSICASCEQSLIQMYLFKKKCQLSEETMTFIHTLKRKDVETDIQIKVDVYNEATGEYRMEYNANANYSAEVRQPTSTNGVAAGTLTNYLESFAEDLTVDVLPEDHLTNSHMQDVMIIETDDLFPEGSMADLNLKNVEIIMPDLNIDDIGQAVANENTTYYEIDNLLHPLNIQKVNNIIYSKENNNNEPYEILTLGTTEVQNKIEFLENSIDVLQMKANETLDAEMSDSMQFQGFSDMEPDNVPIIDVDENEFHNVNSDNQVLLAISQDDINAESIDIKFDENDKQEMIEASTELSIMPKINEDDDLAIENTKTTDPIPDETETSKNVEEESKICESTNEEPPKPTRKYKPKEKNLCPECGKIVINLKLHLQYHMDVKEHDKHVCEICGKKYKRSYELVRHKRTHSDDKRYECKHCGEKFVLWLSRRNHIDREHTGERRYTCKICSEKFLTSNSYYRHVRGHTGETPYECKECHKAFISKKSLDHHMPTHSDEKNFICDVCNKAYSRQKSLEVHQRIHKDERNYVCQVCSASFVQNNMLRAHVTKLHPEFKLPPSGTIVSKRALQKMKKRAPVK